MTVHFRIGFKRFPFSELPRQSVYRGVAGTARDFLIDDESGVSGLDVLHLNLLALELFVVLEEAAQDEQAMTREVARLKIVTEFGIVGGDGNDFIVAGAGIDHGHNADGARLDEGESLDRFLAKDEDVERIIIFRVGLRDEAVGRWVENRGVDDAIDAQQAGGLVQFVFTLEPSGISIKA